MKYKKILTFVTSMIFLSALIFCTVMATKIAEIDVDANTITNSNENVLAVTTSVLEKYENKNIVFLNSKTVASKIEQSSSYVKVLSVKKVFPNKLKVVIEEREELFCIQYNDEYFALDSELKVLSKKQSNQNNVDGYKNLLFKFNIADFDENSLSVNKTLNFYDNEISSIINALSEKISARRLNVSSVEFISGSLGASVKRLVFTMTEGVKITITNYDERLVDKIDCLLNFYDDLDNKGDTLNEYFVVIDSKTSNVVVTK